MIGRRAAGSGARSAIGSALRRIFTTLWPTWAPRISWALRRSLPALLVALSVSVIASVAAAASSRVAVVRPAEPDATVGEATTRLTAELRAAGFDVVLIAAPPGADPRSVVESTPIEPRPFATIAIVATERGAVADLWVADHLSAKTLVRRVDVPGVPAAAGGGPSALAVRAVELLRASLLEVSSARRLPSASGGGPLPPMHADLPPDVARWMSGGGDLSRGDASSAFPPNPSSSSSRSQAARRVGADPRGRSAPHPKAVRGSAGRPAPRLAGEPPTHAAPRSGLFAEPLVEAGVAFFGGFGGFGTTLAPALRLSFPAPLGFGARLSFLSSLSRPELAASPGSASIAQSLLTLSASRAFGSAESSLVPVASAGAGAYALRVQGRGASTYTGSTRLAWAATIDLGAGLGVRLSDRIALLLDVRALVLLPEPVVRVTGIEVGRVGPAMLVGSLGIAVSSP